MNLPSARPHILLAVEYAERLRVPLRWWVQATMLVATLWLAVVVALPTDVAWLITAAAMALAAALLISYGSARVAVTDGTLHAGRAHIPVSLLGATTSLDADGVRRTAGVEADARAYLLLRPYLARGVRVEIADPADPTPYWLVSTRRPDELVAVLDRVGRQHRAGPPDHGVRQED